MLDNQQILVLISYVITMPVPKETLQWQIQSNEASQKTVLLERNVLLMLI